MVLIKRLQLITTSLRSCILSTRPEHPMDHGKLGPLPPYSTAGSPQTAPGKLLPPQPSHVGVFTTSSQLPTL